MTKQVVVLLHGVGSNGDNFSSLANFWSDILPETLFIAPNATLPSHQADGYQWFDIEGVTTGNRASRVATARPSFCNTLEQQLLANDVDSSRDRIFLVGFSQGSIMALDYLIHGTIPLAGVIAFSGRLATTEATLHHLDTPVLLIHGQRDPVISYSETQITAQTLNENGYQVSVSYEPNTMHTISPAGATVAAEFIAKMIKAH